MSKTHSISPALEAVERDIDGEYLRNYLTSLPFSEAAWYFLAFCEEMQFKSLEVDPVAGPHDLACSADELVNGMKTPLRWLWRTCKTGTKVPRRYSSKSYQASWDFARLSQEYGFFEAAYVYARAGTISVDLQGDTIVTSTPFGGDSRYEAYDRLYIEPSTGQQATGRAFLRDVAKTVAVEDDRFFYKVDPDVVTRGIKALSPIFEDRHWLPSSWAFRSYSLGEFRAVASVLQVRAMMHYVARVEAARRGCVGMGYANSVLVMDKMQLLSRLKKYTAIGEAVIAAVVRDLTFGARGIRNPDPALQPLISLTRKLIAIPPALLIASNMERNLTVLLNCIPSERDTYTRLSMGRENVSRERIMTQLRTQDLRFWNGQIPGRRDLPDVDLAIINDREFTCLLLELKAFVQPAEPRELLERSEEIERGIEQVSMLRTAWQTNPHDVTAPLKIDDRYSLCFAVASETSIGTHAVQSKSIPVVWTSHLVRRILQSTSLSEVCRWLSAREYLPVEGRHYEIADIVARVGSWKVKWYGIKSSICGEYT